MPHIPAHTQHLDGLLRKHSTSLTATLFLVVGVTGTILFFHLAKGTVETLHEWLGMLFVAAAILHVVRHRGSFVNLLRQPRTHLLFGLVAMGIAGFILVLPADPGGSPLRQLAQSAEKAPITRLAPVIGISEQEVLKRLQSGGIAASDPNQSLYAIAMIHHAEPKQLLTLVLREAPSP